MIKASPLVLVSTVRRIRKAVSMIELLEPRAYLTGVVLGTPQNLSAALAGIAPVFVNLDDVNGDGKADLIAANDQSGAVPNSISILTGNGDGTFAAAQTVALPNAPLPIAEADLNGDGKLDIVSGNATTVSVLLNDGTGKFTLSNSYTTGLANNHAIALGDFNGDGRPDIAIVGDDTSMTNNLVILMNNGDGTFAAPVDYTLPHTHMAAITTFNSLQLVLGIPVNVTNLAIVNQDGNSVTAMLNNGDGTFRTGASYAVGAAPVSIAQADFNGDGKTDLVVANSQSGNVTVLLGNGDGTFQPKVSTPVAGVPSTGGPLKVRIANMNNDGRPDLILLLGANSTGDAEVMLGNGDGTFHTGTIVNTGGAQRTAIAAGDLNNDGFTDMVIADPTQVTALLNVTNLDHIPPTATVDVTQPAPVVGAATIDFTVTYTDNTQVDATTIQTGNLTVTAPNGAVQTATLVSPNLGNGPSVTATYSINSPSGTVSAADNGTYTVTATSNGSLAVKDANGNALAAGTIGTFAVVVPSANGNGPNLVAGPVAAKFPASAVAGTHARGSARITITNSGNQTAKGTIVIDLFASPDQTIRGNAPKLTTITKKINLRPHQHVTIPFRPFTWPASLNGSYLLVANVNSTHTIAETNLSDNTGASTKAITVAPPFVDIQNLWNRAFPAALKAGRPLALTILLKNLGNVTAKGTDAITVLATPGAGAAGATTMDQANVRVAIPPGKTRNVRLVFKVPALASGSYHIIVGTALPGDKNPGNDTVSSTGTFTI